MTDDFFKRWRVSGIALIMAAACLGQVNDTVAADSAEQLYNTNCGICHTIGGGKLIGPDLAGVHERRSQDWLETFVKSSQTMINSGDPDAVALFEEYNKMLMPDPPFTEAQIREVLAYIKSKEAGATATAGEAQPAPTTAAAAATEQSVTEADVILGRNLFQGLTRFENGGPTCNACHDVTHDAIIGGGILAIELTNVFTKLGGVGVRAILGQAPFPVMEAAYKDKPLTENEIFALVAFLQDADAQHVYQHPRDYGTGLLVSGVIGAFILFGIYSLLWLRRKKESVNQRIYDRQIQSI